jgi:hypothetical protein
MPLGFAMKAFNGGQIEKSLDRLADLVERRMLYLNARLVKAAKIRPEGTRLVLTTSFHSNLVP